MDKQIRVELINPNTPETKIAVAQAYEAARADERRPAGNSGVRMVIGQRFGIFPQPDRTDDEWTAWWSDYYDVLADVPGIALEAGMKAWVKLPDSEFLPRPGRLRELALSTPNALSSLCEQVSQIVWPRTLNTNDEGYSGPRASKQEVAELMAEFRQKMNANRMPEPPKKRSQAPTDEYGISPALRNLLKDKNP